jgi:hypothetical protein
MKKFSSGRISLIGDAHYDVPFDKQKALAMFNFSRDKFPPPNTISFRRKNTRPSRFDSITKSYLDDVVEFRMSNIVISEEREEDGHCLLKKEFDLDVVIDSDGEAIYNIAKILELDYTAAILSPNRGDIRE